VVEIRAAALGVVMTDDEYFPYCTGFDGTADATLRDEARAILKGVQLSKEEKAALEARREGCARGPHAEADRLRGHGRLTYRGRS
jgi:hypothetical protein